MQIKNEELKNVLDKAISDELEQRGSIDNYRETIKSIPEKDYFIFFDVMEAHYLANDNMENYLNDMYTCIRGIILGHHLIKDLDISYVMANSVNTLNNTLSIKFDDVELMGIAHELIERINGKDYLKENEFAFIKSRK